MSPQELRESRLRRARVDGIREKTPPSMKRGAKIAVLGLGRTGLTFCIRAAARGFEAIGFEADEVKVAQLQARKANFLNEEDAERFKTSRGLSVTAGESELEHADCFLICTTVPGELNDYMEIAGRHLKEGALVVVESVVSPGVCEYVLLPKLEKVSGLTRKDFHFAHAPNMPTHEGGARVLGAAERESFLRAAELYRSVLDDRVKSMLSLKEAEAVPMLEDALTDVRLALASEFAVSFDRMGVDLTRVLEAVSQPFAYQGVERAKSAPAYYFTRAGNSHEIDQPLLSSARRAVERMPEYAVKVLSEVLHDKKIPLRETQVALLGLSNDKDPSHTEDVAALKVRAALKKRGVVVKEFDPFVPNAGRDLKETLVGSAAAIITADHAMFCNLQPRQFEESGISVVVDARNCLDKSLFENSPVLYRGIGRSI